MAINPVARLRVAQFLFIQEPMSSLFSFIIFLIIMKQWQKFKFDFSSAQCRLVSTLTIASIGTWAVGYFASTAFHVHENKLTERSDYFLPVISFMTQIVWLAVMLSRTVRRSALFILPILILPMMAFALYFMYSMHFVRFDYGWHMRVVVTLVITQFLLAAPWFGSTRKPYARYWLFSQLSMALAVPFELYDFVPILKLFDGHSLWHASGCLVTFFWCKFMKGVYDDVVQEIHSRKTNTPFYFH